MTMAMTLLSEVGSLKTLPQQNVQESTYLFQ